MKTIVTNLNYEETRNILKENYKLLEEGGSFFAIYSTEYDKKGNVVNDFYDIINVAAEIGYDYVNTIVLPTKNKQQVTFRDNVRYIVWLCKNYHNLVFDKDSIREKHIWKDVEWGKRTKNYNPKGKDPGNVWIPTEDDGKANITKHILLPKEKLYDRLLTMSKCGSDYELYEGNVKPCKIKNMLGAEQRSYSSNEGAKVVFGTSENVSTVKDGVVNTVITSPPYWNLKDYFKKGQIGQESYEEYLQRMEQVWRESYRILDTNGALWVNINIRVKAGKAILIPRDIIQTCKEIGYYYKGIIIWHKSSGIPTTDKNIVDRHEYVLLFTKCEYYRIDEKKFVGIGDYKNSDINGGAFWNINRKAGSVGKKYIHPAIYPNKLVERLIEISSEKGQLIFDPFLGSGTSLIAAVNCKRSFIGYEYNEGFKELMESRFEKEIPYERVEYIGE